MYQKPVICCILVCPTLPAIGGCGPCIYDTQAREFIHSLSLHMRNDPHSSPIGGGNAPKTGGQAPKNPTEEEAAVACSLFMLSEEQRGPRKARPQTVMPRRTTPLQDATNHILAGRDKNSMLEIKYINPVKGRGIFTSAVFSQGDFVVEYRGELIDAAEAEHRRKLYHDARSIFMFDFTWKLKTWCIDGTLEDGSFGRLEITTGTEITYDYALA
ncbi:N-lysine methyltransferase KMT5A-like [Gouania willdenowi]|uniref:N-lysine methyltransferase KMT5A-like n=1 Tax=Gouania willdenowi TaxID=441366 RepID=UPI001056BBFC|nr:N-lysine methyltransferase KMT5A-like [Gouania willdenowi]